jgi:hypothetical protein
MLSGISETSFVYGEITWITMSDKRRPSFELSPEQHEVIAIIINLGISTSACPWKLFYQQRITLLRRGKAILL